MYQVGELVVYGTTGVCRVEEISQQRMNPTEEIREYYRLKPLHQDGVIYSPVDNEKVPMRKVMSKEEVNALIDSIPTIQATACRAPTQALMQRYQAMINSHDSKDLIELTRSIYLKRRQAEAQKRHLGQVDERYMKQAERLLYGEFSVALEIPYEEVEQYIANRLEKTSEKEIESSET